MSSAEQILRSIVADVEAMQDGLNNFFGPFSVWEFGNGENVKIEWPNLALLAGKAAAALHALDNAPPPETHTPNGYDPAWLVAINHALEDRSEGIQLSDIEDDLWADHIGPMLDAIAKEEGGQS